MDFIAILSSIRERRGVAEAVTILNTVCLDRALPKRPVLLCATNAVADNYNARGLAALEGAGARYTGAFEGEAPKAQGDMYIQVEVETPKNLTRRQRELLEEFERESHKDTSPESAGFFSKVKEFFDGRSG